MFEYKFNMAETLAIAAVLLCLGRWIKNKSQFLQKFFIPAPVVSGLIFSIFVFIGRQTETCLLYTSDAADD